MERPKSKLPVIGIILILLACISYDHRGDGWELTVPGPIGGVVVCAIIAVVLLFRIMNRAEEACLARGLIKQLPPHKYDILISVTFLASLVGLRFHGGFLDPEAPTRLLKWEFEWAKRPDSAYFLAAVIGVVVLLRVHTLLRAITTDTDSATPE